MLARLLRPCYRWIPILPLSAAVVVVAGLALPRTMWCDQQLQLGLACAAIIAVSGAARPRLAVTAASAVALSGLLCALCGDREHAALVMELVALTCLPLVLTVLTTPRQLMTRDACEPAQGLSGQIAQVVVLCALPVGYPAALGSAIGATIGLLAPATLPAGRDALASAAATPRALAALPRTPRVLELLPAVLVLGGLLLAGFLHRDWYQHPGLGTWLVLGALFALWTVVTGDALAALFMVGFDLVGMNFCRVGMGADQAMTLLGVLAPAQVLPLSWWWWRFHRGPWPVAVVLGVVAPVVLLLGSTPSLPAIAVAGLLGAGISAMRPAQPGLRPGTPRAVIRAARGSLPIYWSMYLPMKLRLDPMFAQLGRDQRPWRAVLDVGCGPGLGAALAVTHAGTTAYCGIDLDEEKLRVARVLLQASGRELDGDWQLILGRMPFGHDLPGTCDTVLLLDVLHYWDPAEQQRLLSYLRRQTATGGELWLRDGVADASGSAGRVAAGERFTTLVAFNPGGGALHFQTAACLEGWFAQAGWLLMERQESGAQNRLWRLRAQAAGA